MAKRRNKAGLTNSKKNFCFGCGKDNPHSMDLKFTYHKKRGVVACRVKLASHFAGPPGFGHGGIIATMLDEAMAKLNKVYGVTAVTGHLAVDYLRPVPLGQPLHMEARERRVSGRRRFREGEIVNRRGEVLARGTGVFITIDPAKIFASRG
jgi:uncharacterized protein (TIGR00369 family)